MVAKPYQVLIADDDPGFRETLRAILAPFFELIEAECGEEAVEIAHRRRVDLALLDMHMRLMTGLEALRQIKEIAEEAPCILVTADATDELIRDADEANAFEVLSKPVTRDELVTTVSTALEDAYDAPLDL